MLGPVELVDEIDSTNRELLRRSAVGAADGLVLVARHQSAGRGRRDRRWESQPGASLLVSVLLRPRLRIDELHLATMSAGLAAVDAVAEVTGAALRLKWPNDVVHEGAGPTRKVAGLLAESALTGERVDAVVVGMGMNVNWPGEVPAGGASLNQLVGRDVDVDTLLARWLDRFGSRWRKVEAGTGHAELLDDYRAACATIGRLVRVEHHDGVTEGRATGVDDQGHLVLDTSPRRSFAVGDVVHLRAADESEGPAGAA